MARIAFLPKPAVNFVPMRLVVIRYASLLLLLASGVKPDHLGRTPLMSACAARDLPAVTRLLSEHKADVNAQDGDGNTALLLAAEAHSPQIIQALIDNGAELRAKAKGGVNAVLLAAAADDLATTRLLLAGGADPNAAAWRAVEREFDGHVYQLKQMDAPLLFATRYADEAMTAELLRSGARAHIYDESGATPYALANGKASARLRENREAAGTISALLKKAEERELSATRREALPERVALQAIRNAVGRGPAPSELGSWVNRALAEKIDDDVNFMYRSWVAPDHLPEEQPPPSEMSIGLTRDLYFLEWALKQRRPNDVVTVAVDLHLKAETCAASSEGLAGSVKLSVRTILPGGSERRGVRVRYLERFYWDLLPSAPEVASFWHEFAAMTAIQDEPVIAGAYMMIAYSAEGTALSDAKPVDVSKRLPGMVEIPLR